MSCGISGLFILRQHLTQYFVMVIFDYINRQIVYLMKINLQIDRNMLKEVARDTGPYP